MNRKLLLTSAAMVAVGLLADRAQAQTAPAPATSAAPAASAVPDGTVGEIVVTAEKRESTAQRVAASLDVVTGDALQRQQILQLQDLNAVLPSVQLLPFVNSIQVAIRGVESNFVDPRADPAVAISVNGLFFDRPLPTGFAFLDVARVEDLNGPQGTLYGRNAVGGAINIITNQPTDRFGGMAQVTFGNYGEKDVTGVVNLPVTDTLAVRAAYARDRHDGYIGDYYDDSHSDTGRISSRWKPTEKLTIYGEGDFFHQGGHGQVQEAYPCMGAKPWSLVVPGTSAVFPPGPSSMRCTDFGGGVIPKIGSVDTRIESGQFHVDYDFGWMTATSITGYVSTHQRFNTLPNATVNLNTTRSDNDDFSEELRFSGRGSANHAGGLLWQVGAFFFSSTGDYIQTTRLAYDDTAAQALARSSPAVAALLAPSTTTDTGLPQNSKAGFAQATFGVTDRLRVTGGARYTVDYKGVEQSTGKLEQTEHHTTWKGGAEYDLAPGKLLYANVSTGYVAGGPDGGSATAANPLNLHPAPVFFAPETITAYEIGSKNRFFGNRLQLNGDFYYYNVHNLQVSDPATYNTKVSGSNLAVENAGNLTTYGVELNGVFALSPVDHFSASLTWAHGTYGGATIAATPSGTPSTTTIPAGQRIVNLPAIVSLLGYEHVLRFANGSSLTAAVNTKISSSYRLEYGVPAQLISSDTQKGFTMTDISLSYAFASHYTIKAWVKNIENSAVNVYGETGGNHVYGILAPRTFGGTLTVNFL